MHKIILTVVISLVAGFALGAWTSNEGGSDIDRVDNAVAGANLQPLEERLLSLEQLIAEEREARLDLEQQLQSLIDQSDREDASAARTGGNQRFRRENSQHELARRWLMSLTWAGYGG